jgi:Bacterial Ig-like domain (group 2)
MRKIILCALLLSSCGGSQSSPVAPTPVAPLTPAATLVSLSITAATQTVLVGSSHTITATGRFSDGSSRVVAASWSSTAPDVINVDSDGRLTALGAGMASIAASFGGHSASADFRGLPDFAGQWAVEWRLIGCDVPARWGDGFCNVDGTIEGTLTLARTDGDRVSGTYDNGVGWDGSVTGQVSIDGTLTITGRMGSQRSTQRWTADLDQWGTRLSSSAGMTGGYREILTLVGESDLGTVSFEVVSARR